MLVGARPFRSPGTNLFTIKSLNMKFSKYQKQSPQGVLKKGVLEIKILQNSLKNIRDAVFNLILKISG